MKTYALINFGTGEIYSISGENITAQYLYNRALSQRREAIRYGYALDKMHLVRCSDYEHIMSGAVIQEWEGGLNTPIEELGLCVRTYWTLKNRRLDTVGLMLDYIKQDDILRRLPSRALYDLAEIIKPYDEATACGLIRRTNLRRIAKKNSLS